MCAEERKENKIRANQTSKMAKIEQSL